MWHLEFTASEVNLCAHLYALYLYVDVGLPLNGPTDVCVKVEKLP